MLSRMVLLLAAVALVLSACSSDEAVQTDPTSIVAVSVSPNWDYVGFVDPLDGTVLKNKDLVGYAILRWEETHPDRRIVSLQVDNRPHSYGTGSQVYGVMIYSEVR